MSDAAILAAWNDHKESVYRFVWRMTGSPSVAEDVLQEVFLGLIRAPGRFDARRAPLRAFLLAIARNQVRKRWETERRWDTLDDYTFANPKISLNGMLLQTTETGMSGEAVFFYMPGHGRYAMSRAPNLELGFRKMGEIRGSQITIRNGADAWTIDCKRPVAPGGGVFNLYVYPDPAWRPPTGADTWQLGASSARSMIRK